MSENEENGYLEDEEVVSLIDEAGRELSCHIENSLELDGKEYVVLIPVEPTVDIFASDPNSEELAVIQDEATLNEILPTAEAVLAEKNLTLKRTPFVLTVEGELPDPEEEDILSLEVRDEDNPMQPPAEPEELQFLASFYNEEQEYSIYAPLAPLVFFGRLNPEGKAELLSEEEFEKVRPMLEDELFEQME